MYLFVRSFVFLEQSSKKSSFTSNAAPVPLCYWPDTH